MRSDTKFRSNDCCAVGMRLPDVSSASRRYCQTEMKSRTSSTGSPMTSRRSHRELVAADEASLWRSDLARRSSPPEHHRGRRGALRAPVPRTLSSTDRSQEDALPQESAGADAGYRLAARRRRADCPDLLPTQIIGERICQSHRRPSYTGSTAKCLRRRSGRPRLGHHDRRGMVRPRSPDPRLSETRRSDSSRIAARTLPTRGRKAAAARGAEGHGLFADPRPGTKSLSQRARNAQPLAQPRTDQASEFRNIVGRAGRAS